MESEPAWREGVPNQHEAIARCILAMIDYDDAGPESGRSEQMVAEVCAVARELAGRGMLSEASARRIVLPVERELAAWYGREVGARIYVEFVWAFYECDVARELAVS
jgi:hypothetical protein